MKRITSFFSFLFIVYISTFSHVNAKSTAEWNHKSYTTAYASGIALSPYSPDNKFVHDVFGWFLSHSSSLPSPFALSVDLGTDFTLVPSDKSTEIQSNITGTPATYTWTQISGPNTAILSGKNSATLTASNLVVDQSYASQNRSEGYVFRLTVADNTGNTAFDEINIKLSTPDLGPNIEPWTYEKTVTGWDTSPYLPFKYQYMPFRLIYPTDYTTKNDGKKYPLILMIHGRGERGTDNDFQLKNGGKVHKDAVLNGKFNGFVLFPQYPVNEVSPMPTSVDIDNMTAIVMELIANEKVDPDRVHVHGLSTGGRTVWETILRYPKIYASAMPMAWAENKFGYANNLAKYIHLPLWESQGGQDVVAPPERANSVVSEIRKAGGDVRYLYFPNNGHNAWDDTYNDPDFFPFLMRHSKTDILVYYGQTSFCEGDAIHVRMGITPGFDGYEWQKDGVTIATNVNEIVVTMLGDYRVRFKRGSTWTAWSKPVNINRDRAPSPTPSITTNKKSVHLPSLDGSDEVTMYATSGYAQYFWYKDSQLIEGATNPLLTVNAAGTYTVTAVEPGPSSAGGIPEMYPPEPARCESLPSEAIVVTTRNGPNAPKTPVNLFALIRSESSVELNFDDQSNNETGFEIYRSTQSGGPYTLVDIMAANSQVNPVSYFDNNLKDGVHYYYKIRAVNHDGASAYSTEAGGITPIDDKAPVPPQNLMVAGSSRSDIKLQWDPASDNVAVIEYLVFMDGKLIESTKTTSYTAVGLVARTAHTFIVRAKDAAGNISSPSNHVTGASINDGLLYSYYHVSNINTVNDITVQGELIKTGHLTNFSLGPKERSSDYAFIYEGYINIKTEGQYTFYIKSDDGSRLFIDGQEIVNNDGNHGCNEKSIAMTLSVGAYPVKAMFYQGGGGDCLSVSWKGPGIAKEEIPDAVLRDDFTYPGGPVVPGSLQLTAISYDRINLSWQDNSNDETGFEIYRSTKSGGPYSILYTTAMDVQAYGDSILGGNTVYYYKIRAVNDKGASSFTSVKSATTLQPPAVPAVPGNLTATAMGSSSTRLNWTDGATTETSFEIWRTTSATGNGFSLVGTVPANEVSFIDLSLAGNTTLYYKLRAKGDGGYSAFTSVVSITTANNAPVLQDILSRTVKLNTSLSFDVFVSDQDDTDAISFEIIDMPSFGSFTNNNNRIGTFTFAPTSGDGGNYVIQVIADDKLGGSSSKSFTLTVNNNATPVIAPIGNQEVHQGTILNMSVSATDADGNASLQLSLLNNPDFVSMVDNGSGKGTVRIKPGIFESPGTYQNIQVIANDQKGGIGTATFNLVVKGVDKDFTVYINFSSGSFAPFPWNNTGDAGTTDLLDQLADEEGKISGMKLKLRQDGGTAWNSSRSTVNSDLYIQDVRDTRYWTYSYPPINMTLSGLNPLLSYNFTFFGSEWDNKGKSRMVRYSIGDKYGEVQTENNAGETVSITNVKPDQDGNLTVTLKKITSAEWKMMLNAMIVQGYYNDGSRPEAPANLSAKAVAATEVRLNWLDNSKSEEGFEVLRATNSNGPFEIVGTTTSNVTTFTDHSVLGRTTYFYKVRAFNTYGKSAESNVFTVITPNSAPHLNMSPAIAVRVGTTRVVNITATDPDNDPVTLMATGLPAFARFTDHGNGTGTLTISPISNNNTGRYSPKITALDDRSDSDIQDILITVISDEYDDVVYINFNNDSKAEIPWNNTSGVPVANRTYSNLKNALGNVSAVSFTVQNGWSGAGNNGINTSNNTGVFSDSVMRSYWYTPTSASLQFSGLDPSKIYNFQFFASNQATQEGTTAYTIGGKAVPLNAANNSQATAQLNGIIPDNAGKVILTVDKTLYSSGGYLGAVVLQSYQSAVPLSPSRLVAKAIGRTKVQLNWSDNAGNETAYRVYRSQSPSSGFSLLTTLGENANSFVDNTPAKNSTYYYKVLAVNGNLESAYSNMAWATTYEYLIYINFVGSVDKYRFASAPWNNTKASPSTGMAFNNLKNDAGAGTAVDLLIDNWETAGFDNNLGINTGNNSGIYPDAVLESFYFTEHGEFVKFKVKDLDPNYQYSFIFLGSGDPTIDLFQTAGNLTTNYTIGQTTVSQNALGNMSETVQIDGVIPDGNHEVFFQVKPEAFANYAIFNALVIGAYSPSDVLVDELPPSAPANLIASKIAPGSLTLTWDPAFDDSGKITSYEIYNGTQLVSTVSGGVTIKTITNTVPGNVYDFSVLAVDEAGNKSQFSERLMINYEVLNGLNYTYYESVWTAMPDFTALTPVKSGFADNFSLAPKERDHDFGFRFYGYIEIATAGNYTFYTKSNTGSKLYIDGVEIVSNDYPQDITERVGTAAGLSKGMHEFVVAYRDAQEMSLLEVRYEGPGISKVKVPDQVLFRTALVAPVSQPVEFLEVKAELAEREVMINWSTASEINNDYFTIEKSYELEKFTSLGKIEGAGNSSEIKHYRFTDGDLLPGNIYYRIKQTDFDGKEKYSKVVSVSTESVFKLTHVILFPNPADQDNINLKVLSQDFKNEILVTIADMIGSIIFETTFNPEDLFSGQKIEPAVRMSSGSYVVKIMQGNQVIHRRMLIR